MKTMPFLMLLVLSRIDLAMTQPNYKTFGALYNWPAAMNYEPGSDSIHSGIQGICPTGWHLPGDAEWTVLTDYLTNKGYGDGGSGDDIGRSMASNTGWVFLTPGGTYGSHLRSNNSSGFKALLCGEYFAYGGFGVFGYLDYDTSFWPATEFDAATAHSRYMHFLNNGATREYTSEKFGFSVCCLMNR